MSKINGVCFRVHRVIVHACFRGLFDFFSLFSDEECGEQHTADKSPKVREMCGAVLDGEHDNNGFDDGEDDGCIDDFDTHDKHDGKGDWHDDLVSWV